MKFLIYLEVCVIAAFASPFLDDVNVAQKLVRIPDGFGGMKYVNPNAEQDPSPSYIPADDVEFLLFTLQNPLIPQFLRFDDMSSVANSNWSPNRPTKVICHGWQSDINTEVNPLVTASYLAAHDVNVIVVDWSVGAGSINYITSRNRVNETGEHVALFLNNLFASGHLRSMTDVTCVGKSLGAHVCGATGKNVSPGRLHTIFGLDPAGPLFTVDDVANRLGSGDAEYVEIIHTDTVALGIGDPIGHADFYPNGGSNQPGCLTPRCDHAVSARFFAYTINSDRMWGRQCASIDHMSADSCTGPGFSMGDKPSNHAINLRGIFRMPTNEELPYGIGPF